MAFTLEGVRAVNGSSAGGGCPSQCVGVDQMLNVCDCPTVAELLPDDTTGVLFDGIVPTLNVTNNAWATQLFTLRGVGNTTVLSALFEAAILFREVDMYIFYCPSWDIAVEQIVVHYAASYPRFVREIDSLGNVSFSPEMENCGSLIRISIPLSALPTQNYVIEFINPSNWIYIAELRFSDRPIHLPLITGRLTNCTHSGYIRG